jgi:peroxiredoxin family protein
MVEPSVPAAQAPSSNDVAEILRRLSALERTVASQGSANRLSMIVFSGSLDRMIAAFVLASTAAASGMEVDMFFTFWGLAALRDARKKPKKDLIGRMFGWMLPKGMRALPLSQMNMGGMGPAMIRSIMERKRFASLEEMLGICADFGVRIHACDMSREVMGISTEELLDYPHMRYCGAATFLETASGGKVTLFL